MKTGLSAVAALFAVAFPALACEGPVAVCDGAGPGVALVRGGRPVTVYVDADAEKPVARVAGDFAADLGRVSGTDAAIVHSLDGAPGDVVVIGEIGHSRLIDGWITAGRLDVSAIRGQWEAYAQQVIDLPGGRHALVITGADKRGAIYGTYDISAKMGVSPWYWWADVPTRHKDDLYVTAGLRHDQPVVKYRGFFINDEEPSFGGWAREKFGGINHQLYAKVFELDLRLKGNFLWPAMWGKAIADDDPQSLTTADDYGVVLGTSHHEPMTRAQEEWHRHTDQGVTGGAWDYTKNAANLDTFWRGGVERMVKGRHEDVVTIGMRGDGDEPMSEGTATQLLETIVADQRRIIADVTGKPASETPQVWALYKEVQDYYDHGMKVPDDVTLLFSDDNWGQIRRLPKFDAPERDALKERSVSAQRSGGYGVYYHFDYVGGPRNYKWINTNQIEKTWQQMELASEAGADRLWIVNVGDIKPMEYPLSFFLDMAWNPKAMTPEALADYPAKWAGQQFGADKGATFGALLTDYSRLAAQRKPELLNMPAFTASAVAPDDWRVAQNGWDRLAADNMAAVKSLTPEQSAAWFQIAGYGIEALDNLYGLYGDVAHNALYAKAGDVRANTLADDAGARFKRDQVLSDAYNRQLDGKWDHMMEQTHIGYDNWQEPKQNVMPSLARVPADSKMTVNRAENWQDGLLDRGYIAIEAEHFSRKTEAHGVRWQVIPNLGRTLSSVISLPQSAPAITDGSMRLDYDIATAKAADATLNLYLAPTLDTQGQGGLRIGVAIDDAPMQTLSFDLRPDTPQWNKAVEDNILILKADFPKLPAGPHTIHIYRVDGNVVLERLVLDTGGLRPSYLGPPETAQ